MSSRQSSSLSRIHSPRRQTPVPLDPENPGQWVIDHHKHGLIEELKPPTSNFLWRIFNTRNKVRRLDRRFRISFAELQRMRIRKLQCQLVEDVIQMRKNGSEPDDWETTLDHYSEFFFSFLNALCLPFLLRVYLPTTAEILTKSSAQSKHCKTMIICTNAAVSRREIHSSSAGSIV